MDHHCSGAVLHIDATLYDYEALTYVQQEGDSSNEMQRLLVELQRPKPRLVLHELSLNPTGVPRFTFAHLYSRLLERLLLHPNSCIEGFCVHMRYGSLAPSIIDILARCSSLRVLRLHSVTWDAETFHALTQALTSGGPLQLNKIVLTGNAGPLRPLFYTSLSKWLLENALNLTDVQLNMHDTIKGSSKECTDELVSVVRAMATRKQGGKPCKTVLWDNYTECEVRTAAAVAAKLGVSKEWSIRQCPRQ